MRPIFFPTPDAFRRWLEAESEKTAELHIGFYKKSSGRSSITYPEAVDEALCFGWIDGVRHSIDVHAYTIRFTPRKPKSQWSTVNIRHVERLTKAGRMRPAGLKAFEGAKDQPRKYSYEQRHQSALPAQDEKRFRANRKAWDFFQAQAPWYRRVSIFWIMSAKKEETQQRRFATLMTDCQHGQLVKPLRRPAGKAQVAIGRATKVPKRKTKP
jgi:uncharacterized protein YdeI (YjbR/CyaY-like superfamily)